MEVTEGGINLETIISKIGELYVPLTEACQRDIVTVSKPSHFKKGDVVVREGQYSKKAYLIIQGCSRAYYLKDGKDISDWFAFEHEFMAPIVSFFGEEPSPHYLEFVEDSFVLEFSKEAIDELSEKHRDFERLISKIVTDTMLGLCERLYTIQFNKADERYKHLITIHPDIINRIPLTHIASYLGVTLETLSRVRSDKYRI